MWDPAADNKKWVGTEGLQELATPTEGIALQVRQLVENIFQKTEFLYLYFLQNLNPHVRTDSSLIIFVHDACKSDLKKKKTENIWL